MRLFPYSGFNFHRDFKTQKVFPGVILQHPLAGDLYRRVDRQDGDLHLVDDGLAHLHVAVPGAEVVTGVDGTAIERKLHPRHLADNLEVGHYNIITTLKLDQKQGNLAGQSVGGSLGHHGSSPSGRLAVVDNAGEVSALVELDPLDVHLAP